MVIVICTTKNRAANYMKENLIELKKETQSTIIVGDLNSPLSTIDKQSDRKS